MRLWARKFGRQKWTKPLYVIVGEEEATKGLITVRRHGGEDLGVLKVEDFVELVKKEIKQR